MTWHDTTFWAWVFFLGEWTIRVIMLATVPFRRTPTAAKAWLLLILFEPGIGLALYLLIGRATLPRRRIEQISRLPQVMSKVLDRLANHPSIFHPQLAPALSQAVLLAENLGQMPVLGGNAAEILVDYDAVLDRLVADIDRAKHHVHLLFYIFADDHATAPVIAALGRASRRGVRCRVLIDSVGSRSAVSTLIPKLTTSGVAVRETLPVGLFRWRSARLDLRNHRKIAVVDGRVAYTGSQNLVAADFKEGITYEELMLRVTGPAVWELQYIFAADWYLESDEVLDGNEVFPDLEVAGSVPIQTLPSGPDFPTQNNQRLIVALIHGASRRIVITTPYFIPDEPLLQALQTAVLRGVEVHLVLSTTSYQVVVSLAQESYYEELLEAGVKIHLYRQNFLHAKHLTIDDDIALIGTSNMDIRSFVLNAELVMVIYDPGVTSRLRAEQERYFSHCSPLRLDQWERNSFARKLAQHLARLFSPLL